MSNDKESTTLMEVDNQEIAITPAIATRLAALKEKSSVPIEVWRPESVGDCVAGVFTGSRQSIGAYGEQTQMLLANEGLTNAVWVSDWLRRALSNKHFRHRHAQQVPLSHV